MKTVSIILNEWKDEIKNHVNKRERYYITDSCFMIVDKEIQKNELKEIHQWLWEEYNIRDSYAICDDYYDEYEYTENKWNLQLKRLTRPDTNFSLKWTEKDIIDNQNKWDEIYNHITECKVVIYDWCHCGTCETKRDLIVVPHKEEGWSSYICTYCGYGFSNE